MRILLLSEWFDPEPFYRGLWFANKLMALGHSVQVLTGFPNYPGGRLYNGYPMRPYMRETMNGVPVVRVPLYPSHDGSSVKRVATYASFAATAALLGGALVERPDVIYAYHPPGTVGLAAVWLSATKRVPLVYEVHDMWPDTLLASGMFGSRIGFRLVENAMSMVYRAADRIIVLSPGFKRLLCSRGVPEHKIDVVYNWSPDENAWSSDGNAGANASIVETTAAQRSRTTFEVLFAGNLGKAQGLDAVLDAAAIVGRVRGDVRFVFVGWGIDKDRLQDRARQLGLSNTEFRPPVPRENMAPVLAQADALLVHLRDDPLFAITIPSKTQSCLMAGRPVIMAVRGDAARLIARAKAGVVCEPENPEDIARAVLHLREMTPELRAAMGEAGRRYYWRHLSFDRGVRAIARTLENVGDESGLVPRRP